MSEIARLQQVTIRKPLPIESFCQRFVVARKSSEPRREFIHSDDRDYVIVKRKATRRRSAWGI
jgi:hypothetical protein